MIETTDKKVFRGEGDRIAAINAVEGLDISKLHEKHAGAPGEATSYVFPVRAQLTWFRAKNTAGLVETEILFEDPYRAQVKAVVYDEDGKKLSTGHGTAYLENDGRFANKLIETAESRAVSRALDNAGFGCQLSAKTYDEEDAVASDKPASPNTPVFPDGMPAMPGEAPVPVSMPDRINVSKMVDSNSSAQPLDISALEGGDPSDDTVTSPPDKRLGKSRHAENSESPVSEAEQKTPQSTEGLAGEPPPATAEASEDGEEKEYNTPGNSRHPDAGKLGAGTETQPVNQNSAATDPADEGGTQSPEQSAKTVTDMMYEAIQVMGAIQPDGFDKQYFGDKAVDPNAFYINRNGKETRIRNEDLQKAIIFFTQNQEMILDVLFVAKRPEINGKPIREIIAMGEYGESALFTWAFAYRGDILALQAATLVYYQNTPALWRWEQKEPA